ncbi:MAG TPA: hypothetical protein VFZ68_02285 [Acidimicrobiales bacterium]
MTTTTTTTIDLTHPVRVLHDDRLYSLGHRAECGCGWTGTWRDYPADAEADAHDHREVAVGPGDGLDGAMSELLDIQDDLASVVVWLAENWSADLPVPKVHTMASGGSIAARIELWVCCSDLGDLVPLAQVLGVPLVDDDTADSCGTRYRRAVRRFGRVSVQAFGEIDRVPVP